MKTISIPCGIALLATVAFGGCAQTDIANRDHARPTITDHRRIVTGSNVPRHLGRPIAASLANSDPYTHAEDIDRDLGVTMPATQSN